ncbi:hypothetical protein Bbelb_055090 [Branchiostoma belcheri]|nr:hypothetical protein Bbelb_055090 [Branchiostoma belcheri]
MDNGQIKRFPFLNPADNGQFQRSNSDEVDLYNSALENDVYDSAIDALLQLQESEEAAEASDEDVKCQSDPICFLGKRQIKKSAVLSPIENGGYQKRAEVMSDQTTNSDKGPRRVE